MFGTYCGKMAAIGGQNRRDVEPLGEGDHARVRATQRKVRILLDELGHAFEVFAFEVADNEVGIRERTQEPGFRGGAEAVAVDHVADFGDDRRGDDQGTRKGLE